MQFSSVQDVNAPLDFVFQQLSDPKATNPTHYALAQMLIAKIP